jgi:clan AA aspartic protease (TIGR02281 family)
MKLLALAILLSGLSHAADEAELRVAFDAHRIFDLRDAVVSSKATPLYRCFVAAALNDERTAETELREAKRVGASRDQLADAHFALYRLYQRKGKYKRAVMEERRTWELASADRQPSDAERADAEAQEQLPDTEVVSRKAATVPYTTWPDSGIVLAQVTINGVAAQFALDTGAHMSALTEAEAKRLGLKITEGQAVLNGSSGASSSARYGVAERLKIGNTEIRNVSFMVLPDKLEVFETIPLGQQGALGLPVMLAFETMRWNDRHELSIGFPAGRPELRTSSLMFDGIDPLTTIEVNGRRLAVTLDSGGRTSDMWPRFIKEFPELFRNARKGTDHFEGVTGPANVDAQILPELRMKVAGFPVVFRNAPALLETTVPASNWFYAQLGMDLLGQARELTFDFRAMKIVLK